MRGPRLKRQVESMLPLGRTSKEEVLKKTQWQGRLIWNDGSDFSRLKT